VRGSTRTHVNRNVNRNTNVNRNRNTNINRNTNVNRNTNINRNVNVNRDIDIDVDRHYHGYNYHPVGTAIGVAAAAAVIGSIVYSLPPSCQVVNYNGFAYQQCGNTWYQPQYAGSQVTYVVINPPY
jgi:hypothetical protein